MRRQNNTIRLGETSAEEMDSEFAIWHEEFDQRQREELARSQAGIDGWLLRAALAASMLSWVLVFALWRGWL